MYKDYYPEYKAFYNARFRCEANKTADWKYYGGRGIKFLYSSFDEFLQDVGLRPDPKHSLDRIDSNGDYCPGNCRWADTYTQQNNKRNVKKYAINGEERSVTEWARHYGLNPRTVYSRLRKQIPLLDALTMELTPGKQHETS